MESKWLKISWWIMRDTFQQLCSVSHIEISSSQDQTSSSDLITAKQLKKLQLNSQSWNYPWTQGPRCALEESRCFQKTSCRQSRLPLPRAAVSTYESWIWQDSLESIPKNFYVFFPCSGTTSGNWGQNRQTDNAARICQSNTTLSIFKIPVKAAAF